LSWQSRRLIGKPGSGPGEFSAPGGVAVASNGDVLVADFYNHRIQKFSADGTFLARFGTQGAGQGQFDHAIAVAVAGDGTVFAVDFGNSRIQKWRPTER
jgi:DNA-binding beta-propeller fold protein YncE